MAASTRAYSKLVVRLRAQAELEQLHWDIRQQEIRERDSSGSGGDASLSPPASSGRAPSRAGSHTPHVHSTPPVSMTNVLSSQYRSRAGSSTSLSDGRSGYGSPYSYGNNSNYPPVSRAGSASNAKYRGAAGGGHRRAPSITPSNQSSTSLNQPDPYFSPSLLVPNAYHSQTSHPAVAAPPRNTYKFRSPLFKLGHAPLLRVFVPNPEGVWLTDNNIIRCEEELNRAGITPFLKVGDVVWDVAVSDEGNLGAYLWLIYS